MSLSAQDLMSFFRDSRRLTDIDPDMPLFSDGTIDSVGMIELITYLESEAGIEVGQADVTLENFDSIARILAYVGEKSS